MRINVLAFGIAKEIIGGPVIDLEVNDPGSVGGLKVQLENEFPALKKLGTYMIAVNNEYEGEQKTLKTTDEVAIIPPVSGG
jgi:molybdopterin converting factor small subunit